MGSEGDRAKAETNRRLFRNGLGLFAATVVLGVFTTWETAAIGLGIVFVFEIGRLWSKTDYAALLYVSVPLFLLLVIVQKKIINFIADVVAPAIR